MDCPDVRWLSIFFGRNFWVYIWNFSWYKTFFWITIILLNWCIYYLAIVLVNLYFCKACIQLCFEFHCTGTYIQGFKSRAGLLHSELEKKIIMQRLIFMHAKASPIKKIPKNFVKSISQKSSWNWFHKKSGRHYDRWNIFSDFSSLCFLKSVTVTMQSMVFPFCIYILATYNTSSNESNNICIAMTTTTSYALN